MTKLPIVLITNCTSTTSVPAVIRGADLPECATMEDLLQKWMTMYNDHAKSITPAELYRGISFNTVSRIATMLKDRKVFIANSALGLYNIDEKIVPYDFTSMPKHEGSIQVKITGEPFVPIAWWKMLNQAHRDIQAPISRLLEDKTNKLVLIATGKWFIKFMVEDILATSPKALGKLRIITTSQSSSFVPKQLNTHVIRYDKRINTNTVGNRNDSHHRAALHFCGLLQDPEVLGQSIEAHQQLVNTYLDTLGSLESKEDVDLEVFFGAHEDLGNLEPDVAYTRVRKMHRISVHPTKFRQAWSRYFDKSIFSNTEGLVNDKSARDALQSILPRLTKHSQHGITWEDEKRALKLIGIFTALLKEVDPTVRFSSTDVKAWATEYLSKTGKDMPAQFSSAVKLSFLLKTYHEDLNLQMVNIGSKILYTIN